jgi:hypothetical protein
MNPAPGEHVWSVTWVTPGEWLPISKGALTWGSEEPTWSILTSILNRQL